MMTIPTDAWYKLADAAQTDSPALLVYPERVKQNIQHAVAMAGDVAKLRPHIKTHKAAEPVRLMLEAGITKFKCATIAEAELLGMCGAPDVLLAYQPNAAKLSRFIGLVKHFPLTRYSCIADNRDTLQMISQMALAGELVLTVFLDLNVGMNRTGIIPGEEAVSLYRFASALPGTRLAGLHAYDGHINHENFAERARLCQAAFAPVEAMRRELAAKGLGFPLLVAGGTPTFAMNLEREQVECSPGTFLLWDQGYSVSIPEQPFIVAALVLTRVVSKPAPGRVCIDMGHKSVASENVLQRRAVFLNAEGLLPVGHSEEHMVLQVPEGCSLEIGSALYAVPYHVCPTVAQYDHAWCVTDGEIAGNWRIVARDRALRF
ncbi:D-TA family PLP-dependent enzyme [Hufsiella ginkgonis]|uniref:D-TA family PLP-dependent enzyme n=1 Tax=Hufsiella ginkgonis TaxID=2695274 RepID=A0A7K1XXT4_9SPHI|nr:D-TA family PLP-dependent enzyme [Hufsiella ginkgonis]MXV15638.1 D-TA family PLP-dependent enzyme [Hufsiella ginkgonis]